MLAAAKRELREETGYSADTYVLWKAVQPVSKVEWAVYIFVAKGLQKRTDMQLDAGEKVALMPVTFEAFIAMAQQPDFTDVAIYRDVVEATRDPQKMLVLRELLSV